ncbi:MAG TPA: mechanosensitive ion channel family protein [Candidatus Limnocylindria bacterium]|nr:mechanosensitive ion channel family protein [Candidatus Limnocylindria bacterium]
MDPAEQAQGVITWLQDNALTLAFWALVLLLILRFAKGIIHRLLVRMMKAHITREGEAGDDRTGDMERRVATLEVILSRLVRYAVIFAFVAVAFTLLDLWPVLAGVGLLAAALTLAGQPIVLDYLSGILLLFEGPYSIGDVINTNGMEGTVEEIGLRRTVLRDASGTVHSIANGEIRINSNLTRYYASAVVDVVGIGESDVGRAIEVMNRVGAEIATDPEWADSLLEAPQYVSTTAFTELGVTLRMVGRVLPTDRWKVASELRRRLSIGFAEAGVVPNRRPIGAAPGATA